MNKFLPAFSFIVVPHWSADLLGKDGLDSPCSQPSPINIPVGYPSSSQFFHHHHLGIFNLSRWALPLSIHCLPVKGWLGLDWICVVGTGAFQACTTPSPRVELREGDRLTSCSLAPCCGWRKQPGPKPSLCWGTAALRDSPSLGQLCRRPSVCLGWGPSESIAERVSQMTCSLDSALGVATRSPH